MCPALSITNPEPSDCCCSFCGANVFPKNGSCGTFTIAVDVICTTPGAQRLYTSWIDSALLPEKDAGALEGELTICWTVVSLPSLPSALAPPRAVAPPTTAATTRASAVMKGPFAHLP